LKFNRYLSLPGKGNDRSPRWQDHTSKEAALKKMSMERKTTSSNYFNQTFLEEKCALNELIHLLSKRWITEVFFSIEEGNNRFSSIKEDLTYISDHILADRLRLLESSKFITKTMFQEIPVRVEYALTAKGAELSTQLCALCDFAETTELAKS
jgi:DNA-binding HxlR family transcriptional regulator